MQKKFLPFALSFLSLSAIAQPTITNNSNPLHGDTYTYYRCDSVGPGAAGANVTWNFTGLDTIPGGAMTLTYKSCPGWAECDTFPGSNMSLALNDQGGYYIADANRYAWNGEHVFMGPKIKYSDPRDIRRYPFTINNSYTDTHESIFFSFNTDYTRTGTLTETADAYGTLQLPGYTHTNVLRIHYVDVMHDSAHAFPMTADYVRDVYEWWAPGKREFLLRVELLKTAPLFGIGDTTVIPTVIYTNQFPTAVSAEISAHQELKVYPVPARGELTIELSNTVNNRSISLLDIMGKEVTKVACVAGQQQYKVNTLAMPAGVYILRINTDKDIVTRKVEIL